MMKPSLKLSDLKALDLIKWKDQLNIISLVQQEPIKKTHFSTKNL